MEHGLLKTVNTVKPVMPGEVKRNILQMFLQENIPNRIPNLLSNVVPKTQKVANSMNEIIQMFKTTSRLE